MTADEEYRKIGKAVVDECMIRGDERCISITIRCVHFDRKLFIRMEDLVEPLSIWNYYELLAVKWANRVQVARERTERFYVKIKGKMDGGKLPTVVKYND